MKAQTWTERISCPACGHKFDAEVNHYPGEPWASYSAFCPECGEYIGESEWDVVEAKNEKD